jgi:transposase-like protein
MKQTESRRRRVLSDSDKEAHVRRQIGSGKTIAAFCRDEGLAVPSFQNWKRKFGEKNGFIEIATSIPARPAAVEVVLASGDRIVATSDCDPFWLAKLVHSLGAPSC